MTDVRAPIFDAIKAARGGKGWAGDEIVRTDAFLDGFGIGRFIKAAAGAHRLHDKGAFYAGVRRVTRGLAQPQVETIQSMLAASAHWPVSWVAYALATAWHECRLVPIHEMGGPRYLSKYDTGPLAKALGNTPEADGDGILYAGRGLVQLTGKANYAWASGATGLDLLTKPDLALDPPVATLILVKGMEEGAFTGRGLARYLPDRLGTVGQYRDARRIINGTDKADMIAGHALAFQDALVAGEWSGS